MSRYNLSFMMEDYVDDFGNTYNNIPVKIQGNAPKLAELYDARAAAVCSGGLIFQKRHLVVTFADARKLIYPVPTLGEVVSFVALLESASGDDKPICIDFVGEKWNFVPASYLKVNVTFRQEPYTNLPARKTFKSWSFDYTSSIPFNGNELKLVARIPTDNTELETCQKQGLINAEEGIGICSGAAILEGRHYIIQAQSIDSFNSEKFRNNKVIRKAYASDATELILLAQSIGICAQCLGYQGESIPNVHLLVNIG